YTRLDCVIGSAGLMRQAFVQAAHHARHRAAFGRLLADLALESEAATRLMLKLASAFDQPDDPLQRAWRRIVTPAAKFWICKRAIEFTGECMEVWGGNGYVETGLMARLYREAPVNSIWEGSGNVMCLDVLRAVGRDPEGATLLLGDLRDAAGGHAGLLALLDGLQRDLRAAPDEQEAMARRIAQRLVLAAQAALMLRHAPQDVAEAFAASRLDGEGGRVYGTMAAPALQQRILDRAWAGV
ncbi:MAG: DNA alkylation response protein, partial [Oxalobacteraceae bacterium]